MYAFRRFTYLVTLFACIILLSPATAQSAEPALDAEPANTQSAASQPNPAQSAAPAPGAKPQPEPAPALAPQPAPLTATILDSSTNLPLPSAAATLINLKTKTSKTTTADKDGHISFNIPEPGNYSLTISFIGYESKTISPITSGTNLGSIRLSPSATTIAAVVVRSKKPLVQAKADKIVYNASADITNSTGSAADVLAKAPMISVDAEGQVKMRGNTRIKVLLNGLPSGIFAQNLTEALKMIPASTIEAIEVITNPSAKYEAEGAGVINIITKKTNGSNGNIRLTAGNLEQSGNAALNLSQGKFNFNLTAFANNRKRVRLIAMHRTFLDPNDGKEIGSLIQTNDVTRNNRSSSAAFTTLYRPDSSQKFSLGISYWHGSWPVKAHRSANYTSLLDTNQYVQISDEKESATWIETSATYEKKFRRQGQELQLITQVSGSGSEANYLTDQFDPAGHPLYREQGPNNSHTRNYSFQADYTHPLNASGNSIIELGGRFARNNAVSVYNIYNNRGNPGSSDLIKDTSRSNGLDFTQRIAAAYVGIKIETPNGWTIRPGLRYEYTSFEGEFRIDTPGFGNRFSNWVPNLLFAKKLNDRHDIKFGYSQRLQRAEIWDLNPYVVASDPRNLRSGNPNLLPEVVRTIELGENYKGNNGMSLATSLYYSSNSNTIDDLTIVDSLGISRTSLQNIASSTRVGTNINLSFRPNADWTINAGGEYAHTRFRSQALRVRNTGDYFNITLNSSYTFEKNYSIGVNGGYNNGYVTLQGRGSRYYNYGITAKKELFNKKASIALSANNFFSEALQQYSYASAPTFMDDYRIRFYNRGFTASIQWQFGSLKSNGKENSYSSPSPADR